MNSVKMTYAIGALVTLAALSSCDEKKDEATAKPDRPVLMTTIESQPVYPLDFVGSIEPQIATQKAFRVAGQVLARNVKVGSTVKKGDVLAVLDTSQLELGVRSAEASLASAQSQLTNAQSVDERAKALAKDGFASDAQLQSSSQNLTAANARVESAKAQLDKAREQVGYAELIADYDGIVTATSIEVGEQIGAGVPVVTIARPDLRDAVIDVPEDALGLIQMSDTFVVTTTLQPNKPVEGQVREIAPGADSLTHTIRVKIAIGNAPPNFRIGTMINATAKKVGKEVMLVPASAVLDAGGKRYLWEYETSSGTIKKVPIEATSNSSGGYMVTGGIAAGSEVAVAGIHSLIDGQKVTRAEGLAR
jgi:membrane fusion protein, multidrug efflux system